MSRTGADFGPPRSASVSRFAAATAGPPPCRATACVLRPGSASDRHFVGEVVCAPLLGAAARDALPCPVTEWRFASEVVCPAPPPTGVYSSAGESEWRAVSRAGAEFVPPRSASVSRFAAETAGPPPFRATACDLRPGWHFASEVVCAPLLGAAARDALPCPVTEWRFASEVVCPAPPPTGVYSSAGESEWRTVSRAGAEFVPPRSASVSRFATETAGPPPFRATACDLRPGWHFASEVVCTPLFGAAARDALPRPVTEWRFASEVVCPSLLPTNNSFGAESERQTLSRTAAEFVSPCAASAGRFGAEGPGRSFAAADFAPPHASSARCFAADTAPPSPCCATARTARPSWASAWRFAGGPLSSPLTGSAGVLADPAPSSEPRPPVRRTRGGRAGS